MPRFVIQQHDATSLHYDFRLEIDGVFVSWAVPKGPSTDPRDKRLAMQVDDHRLSRGDFEGVIGSGYGAGAVIVWDRDDLLGDEPAKQALEEGTLRFWLDGEKLKGGYTLRRTRDGTKPQWRPCRRTRARPAALVPEFDGNVKVSSLQTGLFAGPLGSKIGQSHFSEGLVVREEQASRQLYTPTHRDEFAAEPLEIDAREFHTYAAPWKPGKVTFYVDGHP